MRLQADGKSSEASSSKLQAGGELARASSFKKIQSVVVLFIIFTTIPNHLPSLNDFVG